MKRPAKKTLGYIGLGIGSFVLFLVYQFPAAYGWQWVPANMKRNIYIQNIEGSIWSGKASNLDIAGESIDTLHWQLNLLPLLTGTLSLDIQGKSAAGSLQARVDLGSATQIDASDITGKLHAEAFNGIIVKSLPIPIMLRGEIRPEIESLHYVKGKELNIDGTIHWQQASLEGVQSLPLGEVKITSASKNTGSTIRLENSKGVLDIDGNLQLNGDGSYNLQFGLLNSSNRPDIDTILRMVGKADATGRYVIRKNGKLKL